MLGLRVCVLWTRPINVKALDGILRVTCPDTAWQKIQRLVNSIKMQSAVLLSNCQESRKVSACNRLKQRTTIYSGQGFTIA